MSKFPKPAEYYKLYENRVHRQKEYEKLLKELSSKTTSKKYFKENSLGRTYKKRNELHRNIVNSILNEYKSSNKPRIHFLLGSIGSGKTSAKDQILTDEDSKSEFVFINFDDLKKQLPEYGLLKRINPKQAAQFVQSESATLAGKLFKKAIQKKYNIIFEKNVRKDIVGKMQLKEEIKRVVKRGYLIFIHIVFLDSYEEAWKRVQKRAEEIKRFVPKQEVKETFNDLFPNFNALYKSLFRKSLFINLWYNGSDVKEAVWLSSILTGEKYSKYTVDGFGQIKPVNKKGFYVGWIEGLRFSSLPPGVLKRLKKLDFFSNIS